MLGAHEIERRCFMPAATWHKDLLDGPTEEPIYLRKTPLSWLKADCWGVAVLDWPAAAFDLLGIWSAIVAEDIGHGLAIRRRLSRPVPCPPILVPAAKEAA